MNTIGKILVICTLLAAIATAAFIVAVTFTSKNWRDAYEGLKREMAVRDASTQAHQGTSSRLNTELKAALRERDEARDKLKERDALANSEVSNNQIQLDEANIRTKDAELTGQRLLQEVARLKDEVNGLLVTVQARDKIINGLTEDNKRYKIDAVAKNTESTIMQDRNLNLLKQIQELQRNIAEMQNKGTGESTIVRDPNQPNPPSNYVKGKIEKIDTKDRSLVQLSVGSDHGVRKNHTLEVFRRTPRAEFLGTVRIIDSQAHYSVGRLMRSEIPHSPLQEGDIVASSLDGPP